MFKTINSMVTLSVKDSSGEDNIPASLVLCDRFESMQLINEISFISM